MHNEVQLNTLRGAICQAHCRGPIQLRTASKRKRKGTKSLHVYFCVFHFERPTAPGGHKTNSFNIRMAAFEASQIGVNHGNPITIPHSSIVRRDDPRRLHCGVYVVDYLVAKPLIGKRTGIGHRENRAIGDSGLPP